MKILSFIIIHESFSIILYGGYVEDRREEYVSITKPSCNKAYYIDYNIFLPGSINFIGKNDFHRIDLIEEYAWTLFFFL